MMTSYFQALGKAIKSLTITVLRNAALFIPRVIILNYIWKLNGVIAAQGKYVAATTRRRRRILPCRILFYIIGNYATALWKTNKNCKAILGELAAGPTLFHVLCFCNSLLTNIIDRVNAEKSAIGPANNTPMIPKRSGSVRRSGIRKKTCLVSASKAPFIAFPMAVKKLEERSCTPFTNTIKR